MKKILVWMLCVVLLLAATACGQEAAQPDAPATTAPAENDGPGIGGDNGEGDCLVHNRYYHGAMTAFPDEQLYAFIDSLGENADKEDINIINFVQYYGVTREEFIEAMNGLWTEENLDEIASDHGNGCPYTREQFLDAIYGDDPELTAWVFAPDSAWPMANNWDAVTEGEMDWPPEGYGFGETRPTEIEE